MCKATAEAGALLDAEAQALRAENERMRFALLVCERAFRMYNFRGMSEKLSEEWADYCAAAQGVPHMSKEPTP